MSQPLPSISFKKCPPKDALVWIVQAWRLFRTNPLGIHLAVFVFFIGIIIASVIPIIGVIVPVLLMPLLSVGVMTFMRACAVSGNAAQTNAQFIQLMLSAFKEPVIRNRLMVLGLIYGLCNLGALGLQTWFDDGYALSQLMRGASSEPTAENQSQLLLSFALLMGATSVIAVLFWFAPLLIAWHGQSVGKAIFFSMMGSLRNLGPFLIYGALGITVLFGTLFGLSAISQLIGLKSFGSFIAILLIPMFMVLTFCTFYTSYVALIDVKQISIDKDVNPTTHI